MRYRQAKRKIKAKKFCIDLLYLLLGCIFIAFGTTALLLPNKLSTGGFTGITTIIYYLFNVPIAVSMVVLNIPLYIFAIFKMGKKLFVKSVIGLVFLTVFFNIFERLGPSIVLTYDKLLASIYGGFITGIGMALVLKANASTGGTDMLSYVIRRYSKNLKTGKIITIIDIVIIAINVIVFKEIEIGLYSAIAIYLVGKMIDIIFEGVNFTKALFIVSSEPEKIARTIALEANRGCTGLDSKGMYTEKGKTMLFCVVSRNEVARIKNIALRIDNKAFVVIVNAREVLGKGFKREE